jgi:predicted permease
MGLEHLWKLYLPLVSWVSFGLFLGYRLPQSVPLALGKFLFWVGVPLSTFSFLRQVDLSASVWLAPIAAWIAMLLGVGLAWLWIQAQIRGFAWPMLTVRSKERLQQTATQGSFLLASMLGNTGYLGYPIALALVGTQHFGWTVFYDTLGSTLGAYGFGSCAGSPFW